MEEWTPSEVNHLTWIQAQHPGSLTLSIFLHVVQKMRLSHTLDAWTSWRQTRMHETREEKAGGGHIQQLQLMTSTFTCHIFTSVESPASVTSFPGQEGHWLCWPGHGKHSMTLEPAFCCSCWSLHPNLDGTSLELAGGQNPCIPVEAAVFPQGSGTCSRGAESAANSYHPSSDRFHQHLLP